jgi:amino acid adenylation domain-containing protein
MQQLLRKLNELNITIGLQDQNLNIKAPTGVMTEELLTEIKKHKTELLAFLADADVQSNAATILKAPQQKFYPLSFSQYRLWLLQQIEKDSVAYNMPSAYRIKGNLQYHVFEKSLHHLIDRYEILRTNFIRQPKENQPIQKINAADEHSFSLTYQDFSNRVEKEKVIEDTLQKALKYVFDLEKDSLLKVHLIKTDTDIFIVFILMHHIISDGWSAQVFLKDLFEAYEQFSVSKEAILAPLPIQYKDYTVWQRKFLQSEQSESMRNYWNSKLKHPLPTLEVPSLKTRPSQKTYNGKTVTHQFNTKDWNAFKELCDLESCTTFMGLVAVLNGLLYRYTAQETILIGSPFAGRSNPSLENQIGFFVNMLPLLNVVKPTDSFRSLLKSSKVTTLEAFQYQEYPINLILDKLETSSDRSRHPAFDIIISVENKNETYQSFRDLHIEEIFLEDHTSKFDLEFVFQVSDTNLDLRLTYNTDIYDDFNARQLASHFEGFLKEVVKNPGVTLREIDYLRTKERERLLYTFNDTKAIYPHNKTFAELFDESVANYTDNAAIVFEGRTITYRELDNLSDQMIHHLHNFCYLKKNDFVGVKLERSDWLIISFVAILKSGMVYVPIDTTYPQERVQYIKEDSKCSVIIDENFISKLNSAEPSSKKPYKEKNSENLAYMIYTSGSTGQPKGVMVNHQNLINLCYWHRDQYSIDEHSKATLFSGISFDASIWEICPYLLSGSSLYPINDSETRLNINYLCAFLESNKISHTYLPTTVCHELIANEKELKYCKVLTGGDSLKITKLPKFKLYNNYGPTENTVVASCYEVSQTQSVGVISIGKPISNTQVYILDSNLQLLPVGVPGNLFISGKSLSTGYLNKDELTRAAFIENPFSRDKKMYDTGDIARWLPDGNIEFLGRKDQQIQLKGHRIELGEIEHAIQLYTEEIKQVIVRTVVRDNHKQLVAYYKSLTSLSIEAIQDYLSEKLPAYMIPAYFIEIAGVPLTPNGKIDFKKLPEPTENYLVKKVYRAPQNKTQEVLVAIWRQILSIENVGVKDNFFDLGGDSLKTAYLASAIAEKFEVSIKLNTIFENPTIEKLEPFISISLASQNTHSAPAFSKIEKVESQETYLTSYVQKRFWFLSKLEEDTSSLNLTGSFILPEKISTNMFAKCLQELIVRHEILRTVFKNIKGEPRQIILSPDANTYQPPHHKVPNENLLSHEERIFNTRFELEQWPLFEINLVENAENSFAIFAMHHIISDGWSLEIFKREFLTIYSAFKNSNKIELPRLEVQYKDYAHWEFDFLNSKRANQQKEYWKKILKTPIVKLELPYDNNLIESSTSREGKYVSIRLSKNEKNQLQDYARSKDIRVFSILVGCFSILLQKLSHQNDIIIGIPASSREQLVLRDLMGPFLNTLLLRCEIDPATSITKYLKEVNERLIEGLENNMYPLEGILEDLDFDRDKNTPITNVFFNLLDFGNENDQKLTSTETEKGIIHNAVKFDLECYIQSFANGIEISCVYKSDLFHDRTIDVWMNTFKELILKSIALPEATIEGISLFEKPIRQNKEIFINKVFKEVTYSDNSGDLISSFYDKARIIPDQPAIIDGNQVISYSSLKTSMEILSGKIYNIYSIKDSRVALLLSHGANAVYGIMGVLNTGNSYVPLDATYPEERLKKILLTSNSKLLICDHRHVDLAKSLVDKTDIPVLNLSENNSNHQNYHRNTRIPEKEAYVLFTSGSTGVPKGVIQNHKNVLFFANQHINNLKINQKDRLCWIAGYSFDGAVVDIFSTLLAGATLVPYDLKRLGLRKMKSWLIEKQITIYHSVPSLFRKFISGLSINSFPNIRLVILGGEAVYETDFRLFCKYFQKNSILVNLYGAAEASIMTQKLLNHNSQVTSKKISLGQPLGDTQIAILNQDRMTTEIYEKGEIVYLGNASAIEYLNQEELSNQIFKASESHMQRLYKTGDFGRIRPDGEIEFLYRKDAQVKLNGIRIDLGEIEQHLLAIEGVTEAAVTLNNSTDDNAVLVAYLTVKHQAQEKQIIQFLKQRLPFFMVPNHFMFLEEFPLTVSGKPNRTLLPELNFRHLVTPKVIKEGRNETEKKLIDIWKNVLDIDTIGITQNFFKIGGDSIKVMSLADRIQDVFQIDVPYAQFFEFPTIEEFSRKFEKEMDMVTKTNNLAIDPSQFEDIPLAPAQYNVIAYENVNIQHYNDNCELRFVLPADITVDLFKTVANLLIQRHDVLRGRFYKKDGHIYQELGLPHTFEFEILKQGVDHTEFNREDFYFDLTKCPPYKAYLIIKKDGEREALFYISHLVMDEYAMQILSKEFLHASYEIIKGTDISKIFSENALQYADYALYENHIRTTPAFIKMESYWENLLKPELPRPSFYNEDCEIGRKEYGPLSIYTSKIDSDTSNQLIHFSAKQGIPLSNLLHANYTYTLHKLSGKKEFLIGSLFSGRNAKQMDSLVGLLATTVMIYAHFPENTTLELHSEQMNRQILESLEAISFQYNDLVKKYGLDMNTVRMPLADYYINVKRVMPNANGGLPEREGFFNTAKLQKYDMLLILGIDEANSIELTINYRADIFKEKEITRFVDEFHKHLIAISSVYS